MLHMLKPAPGSRKARKRVARGTSGKGGMTAGRGTKGQQARAGKGRRFGFEGGQTPLLRRQPKLGGFRSPRRRAYEIVTLATLEQRLPAGSYDVAALREAKILRTNKPAKLLATGTVQKKFHCTVHAASAGAKEAIEKAGGSVSISAE